MIDHSRTRFENNMRRIGFSEQALTRCAEGGDYTHPHVHYAWVGWQAAVDEAHALLDQVQHWVPEGTPDHAAITDALTTEAE